jgi:hypothetical protein
MLQRNNSLLVLFIILQSTILDSTTSLLANAFTTTNTGVTIQARTTTSSLFVERRFAQQPQPQPQPQSDKDVPPGRKPRREETYGSDSTLMSIHQQRVKTAGRVGTKRFVDPCKVFVGNLPFDADADMMTKFILQQMGQTKFVLHRSKLVTDWKTGKSKGYGFIEFTDPIFATVCMDVCNGRVLNGRPLSISQGKKKDQDNLVYLKKKKSLVETEEERVISTALDDAESNMDDDDDDEEAYYETEELDIDEDGVAIFGNNDNDDLELDARLFGIAALADDDDGMDDGIFLEENRRAYEELIDPNMNRAQRREAAKRLKKKKLPSKGFG